MKTFLDLLATDYQLEISVNGRSFSAGLYDDLQFVSTDTVSIDGLEVLPKYHYLAENGTLNIKGPFYNWLHTVSGQGWLLKPQ